jgi:subtilase family serine protease
LEELKKQGAEDMQKVYDERIAGLTALQQEKQKIFDEQLAALKNKSNINWVAVIIAIILGLIIGYLIRGR